MSNVIPFAPNNKELIEIEHKFCFRLAVKNRDGNLIIEVVVPKCFIVRRIIEPLKDHGMIADFPPRIIALIGVIRGMELAQIN